MGHFLQSAGRLLESEESAAAVEYAVLLALIIGACVTSVSVLGASANSAFEKVSAALATSRR
jgi:pilus assembly protein Flp/PilA